MLSSLCTSIRGVRAEEFSDIRSYATEFVVREVMMFGKTPEEMADSRMGVLLGDGFGQSIDMVAAELGVDARPREAHRPQLGGGHRTDRDAGRRPRPRARSPRSGSSGTAPSTASRSSPPRSTGSWARSTSTRPWTFGPDGQRFEVTIDGDPPARLVFHGIHPESLEAGVERNAGIVVTAMHCVNAIPYVCAAEPGIRTYLDLPLIAGRMAPAG